MSSARAVAASIDLVRDLARNFVAPPRSYGERYAFLGGPGKDRRRWSRWGGGSEIGAPTGVRAGRRV